MISQIVISGFRSIKEASIPLKKLNILYGQNGSGKSSVMYAPYVFRNFYANPNQSLNSLFNLGFINLGGFKNVRTKPIIDSDIKIGITLLHEWTGHYDLSGKLFSFFFFIGEEFENSFIYVHEADPSITVPSYNGIDFTFPYNLDSSINVDLYGHRFRWNGLVFESIESDYENFAISEVLNQLFAIIKGLEIISVKRGFFNSIFSIESSTEESKFAHLIRDEGEDLESLIDVYFQKIFDKTFRFVAIPGIDSFYLRTQNKKGIITDLVNEGFGVNQTVYMLIKLLKKSTSLAFIEEPEIHLHPSAQAKLVDVFAEIVQKEDKQIFLTTHSENIVSSVLAKIAAGELSRDDVQFYLAKNEDGETKIIPQEVNDKGQIEGGLMNFMEAELSNLKTLLGL